MQGARGSFVAFATAAGKVANEIAGDSNGLFTKHLVAALGQPGLSLDEVFNKVRAEVERESGGEQLPYVYSGVVGDFYFRPPASGSYLGASGKLSLEPNVYYRLVAKHSGKCLYFDSGRGILLQDVCGQDLSSEAFRFVLRPDGFYSVLTKELNQCLDVAFGIEENDTWIGAYFCNNTPNQGFQLKPAGEGYHTLVAKHSGKCVSIINASHLEHMSAVQWECLPGTAGAYQQFRIEPWLGK